MEILLSILAVVMLALAIRVVKYFIPSNEEDITSFVPFMYTKTKRRYWFTVQAPKHDYTFTSADIVAALKRNK